MKVLQLLIIPVFLFLAHFPANLENNGCKNSQYLLTQSQRRHDPDQKWEKATLRFHIQEPRVQNPERYSKISLDNEKNAFLIDRIREEGEVRMAIDEQGQFQAQLLGSETLPDELVEKYGLNKERGEGYRNFYRTMYGLPMSITDERYERIEPARSIKYRGKDAYQIDLELKEALISKYWSLIISSDDFELLALTLNDPEDEQKGELIEFDGEIVSNDMTIPRIRHWYDKGTREYLGSDIIVNEIK